MSLICKSCNHINLDITLYCANCGKKVVEEKAKKIELERTSLSWIDIVLIFALIIFIIILIVLAEKDKNFIQLQDVFRNETIQKENDKYLLEVRARPSDSTISILESNQPYYKDMLLDEGNYTIIVSRDGYKTFSKKIILKRNSYVTAKLEKNILEKTKKNIWECKIQWIIDNGEKYKPTNENLQTLSIELIDGADKLYLKTQNGESIYNYNTFIDLKDNNLGMEYTLGNRFISIFENKTLFLGSDAKGIDTKYYCKDMVLDITKSLASKSQKKINTETVDRSNEKFSLIINPIPSKARVRILNIKPRYYDGIKLKEGNYHIEISHDGYRTMKKWIKLDSDSSLSFSLKEIRPIAIQSEQSKENDRYIYQGVNKALSIYLFDQGGMAGMRNAVEGCYSKIDNSSNQNDIKKCFSMDVSSHLVDYNMAKMLNFPQNDFFLSENVDIRLKESFNLTKMKYYEWESIIYDIWLPKIIKEYGKAFTKSLVDT